MNPSQLSNLVLIFSAWGAAFFITLWVSLIFWAYRDIRQRTHDRLLRILSTLAVAVLFLPGVVIYLILRPSHTLEEEYQLALEEEALLQAIENTKHCPGCSRHVEHGWLVCPDCHTRLNKACHQCGKLMELHWNLCPHCGTAAPGMRKEGLTMDEALRPIPTGETTETSE